MPRRRNEAGEIAGDTAADRDDGTVAPDTALEQRILERLLRRTDLVLFAGRKREQCRIGAAAAQPPDERLRVQRCDPVVRDDDQRTPGRVGDEVVDQLIECTLPDADTAGLPSYLAKEQVEALQLRRSRSSR